MANTPLPDGAGRPQLTEELGRGRPEAGVTLTSAPAAEGAENARAAPEPPLSPLFVANLLAILGLGVAVSAWILYYTDWFPAVGGLLALGGVVSWLAFVSRVLSEDRMKALQAWADRSILCRRATLASVALLAAAGLVAASFLGAIQVESVREPADRYLRVDRVGSAPGDEDRLRAGEVFRVPARTSFFAPSRWLVKVSGYPDAVVTVRPWQRIALSIPASFRRPVVLLRPTVDLFDEVHNIPRKLTVQAGGRTYESRFDGHPVWIGCDEDVDVPLRLEVAWRAEVEARRRPSVVNTWLHPVPLTAERLELKPGGEVVATLFDEDQKPWAKKILVRRDSGFPQEEVLDVRR
ncbi:MAG TPA: hypothetical protein VGQ32_05725 [Thermoanaerobaculia bacterium]|nr:hypothetical protein [Thermoanaerobaculia bacterium]